MPLLLPLMMTELKLSYLEAGLAVSMFFISYALFQLPVGFIARRVDKRYLLGPGLAVSCVGMMLTSTASNFPQLLIFQAVSGLGSFIPSQLWLASSFPPGSNPRVSDSYPPLNFDQRKTWGSSSTKGFLEVFDGKQTFTTCFNDLRFVLHD